MAQVKAQVSTDNDDIFMTVDEDALKEIALRLRDVPLGTAKMKLLEQMRKDFWIIAKLTTVSRTSECEYNIVLDGVEDEDSWHDVIAE